MNNSNIGFLNPEQQMHLLSTYQQLEANHTLLQTRNAFLQTSLQAKTDQLSQIESLYASAQRRFEKEREKFENERKEFQDLTAEMESFRTTDMRDLQTLANEIQATYQTQVMDLVKITNDALSKNARLTAENEALKRELEMNRFSASLLSPDPENRLSENILPSPSPTNE